MKWTHVIAAVVLSLVMFGLSHAATYTLYGGQSYTKDCPIGTTMPVTRSGSTIYTHCRSVDRFGNVSTYWYDTIKSGDGTYIGASGQNWAGDQTFTNY